MPRAPRRGQTQGTVGISWQPPRGQREEHPRSSLTDVIGPEQGCVRGENPKSEYRNPKAEKEQTGAGSPFGFRISDFEFSLRLLPLRRATAIMRLAGDNRLRHLLPRLRLGLDRRGVHLLGAGVTEHSH